MPILFILLLFLSTTINPTRKLSIVEQGVEIEIVRADLIEGERSSHFRKLVVKKDQKVADQILLKESDRGDYNYQIFDYYIDKKSRLVVIGSYDKFYLYDLQSFRISDIIEICQEKYCEMIDAQSCAIFRINFMEKGQKISLHARDCEDLVLEVKEISFSR